MSLAHSSVVLALSFGAAASAVAHQIQNLPDVVESVMPSVVKVTCKPNKPDNPDGESIPLPPGFPGLPEAPKAPPAMGQGTGVVIDATKGYIITNDHVAGDCSEIKVIPHGEGQKPITAMLVGKDELTDIAVLKIPANNVSLRSARLGDSNRLRVGEDVFAIGHPFGLTETVTLGIVSAKGRAFGEKPYGNFIQTDTTINPGNSGGPLFNATGEVVAINNMIFSRTGQFAGVGFSIPINQAKLVADKLIESGNVPWGYMGAVIAEPSEENAAKARRSDLKGVWIEAVDPNGPAARGGLKSGDIVLSVNGALVNKPADFARNVAETFAGNKVKLELWRNGRTITREFVIGKRPDRILPDIPSLNPGK